MVWEIVFPRSHGFCNVLRTINLTMESWMFQRPWKGFAMKSLILNGLGAILQWKNYLFNGVWKIEIKSLLFSLLWGKVSYEPIDFTMTWGWFCNGNIVRSTVGVGFCNENTVFFCQMVWGWACKEFIGFWIGFCTTFKWNHWFLNNIYHCTLKK